MAGRQQSSRRHSRHKYHSWSVRQSQRFHDEGSRNDRSIGECRLGAVAPTSTTAGVFNDLYDYHGPSGALIQRKAHVTQRAGALKLFRPSQQGEDEEEKKAGSGSEDSEGGHEFAAGSYSGSADEDSGSKDEGETWNRFVDHMASVNEKETEQVEYSEELQQLMAKINSKQQLRSFASLPAHDWPLYPP